MHTDNKHLFLLVILWVCTGSNLSGQSRFWEEINKQPATLGVERGTHDFKLSKLNVKLLRASQTVSSLKLNDDDAFDYTPDELLHRRDRNGFYHLGDINLAIRAEGETSWTSFSSAKERRAVTPLKTSGKVLAAANISASLGDIPLQVDRFWEERDGDLCLRFVVRNNTKQVFEIGALGIPMIFNNNMDGKSLDSAHADNVFFDPYIGKDAGYLQVNRLHGLGPSLLVLPENNTPFEAYNPLNTDPTPRSITFEGFHEWLVHSKAFAETDWRGVEQWNRPTSTTLKPGESRSYGLRFVLAPGVKQVEDELIRRKRPVAMGIPGYLVPLDNPAKLFLKYPEKVKRLEVFPAGSLSIESLGKTAGKWSTYLIKGNTWGRSRLEITYADGLVQTISYKVIKSEREIVKDLGHFLTTAQWYENPDDPFGRSPSVITYDYETKSHVTQHKNAWFAGLSDEAGAASWLAAIMKQLLLPDTLEIEKLKRFTSETMFGRIQHTAGKNKYGVVKSLFYYEPDSMPAGTYSDSINYKTWAAWPKKEADNVGRSYNYPHVAAAHWVLYRLARNYAELRFEESWRIYLERAYETAVAMVEKAPHYAQFGQMEGSVFLFILTDLRREGLVAEAARLETIMKNRALHWKSLAYPFGSEMPWDSTGQEEVYLWSRYFGFDEKAQVTLNAILAYMPTVPHWGYNGSARRYWDFVYGGKLARIERQLHHYGSALNAIPVLTEYRAHPDDLYLLRVGHAGMMGALANVTQDGFAPGAFHSYPSTLANDGISGDYGSGFYGYAVNSGTYIIRHPEFGWLAFSGRVDEKNAKIHVDITTASKGRIFLAEEKVWLTADAGTMETLVYDTNSREIEIAIQPSPLSPNLFLRIEGPYTITGIKKDELGRYVIPGNVNTVKLHPEKSY